MPIIFPKEWASGSQKNWKVSGWSRMPESSTARDCDTQQAWVARRPSAARWCPRCRAGWPARPAAPPRRSPRSCPGAPGRGPGPAPPAPAKVVTHPSGDGRPSKTTTWRSAGSSPRREASLPDLLVGVDEGHHGPGVGQDVGALLGRGAGVDGAGAGAGAEHAVVGQHPLDPGGRDDGADLPGRHAQRPQPGGDRADAGLGGGPGEALPAARRAGSGTPPRSGVRPTRSRNRSGTVFEVSSGTAPLLRGAGRTVDRSGPGLHRPVGQEAPPGRPQPVRYRVIRYDGRG